MKYILNSLIIVLGVITWITIENIKKINLLQEDIHAHSQQIAQLNKESNYLFTYQGNRIYGVTLLGSRDGKPFFYDLPIKSEKEAENWYKLNKSFESDELKNATLVFRTEGRNLISYLPSTVTGTLYLQGTPDAKVALPKDSKLSLFEGVYYYSLDLKTGDLEIYKGTGVSTFPITKLSTINLGTLNFPDISARLEQEYLVIYSGEEEVKTVLVADPFSPKLLK